MATKRAFDEDNLDCSPGRSKNAKFEITSCTEFEDYLRKPETNVFERVGALNFICTKCNSDRSLNLNKPDKSKLAKHLSTRKHRNNLFSKYYFIFQNDMNEYYCGLCYEHNSNKTFPKLRTDSKIEQHQNQNKLHIALHEQLFDIQPSQNIFKKVSKKPESEEDKQKDMKSVAAEFENEPSLELENRQNTFNHSINVTTYHFNCKACRFQFNPSNYHYNLKRNATKHLKCKSHKKAVEEKASGITKSKYTLLGKSSARHYKSVRRFNLDEPIAPRYNSIEFAVDAAQLLVETGLSFNSGTTENKFILEQEFGRSVSAKVITRGLNELTNRIFNFLKSEIQDKRIAFIVDETTKKYGNFLGLMVVTVDTKPIRFYRLSMIPIPKNESCDSLYIFARVFDLIELLWPNGHRPDQLLAIISDGVSYMESAVSDLKRHISTQNILQVKCLVHGIHRVAEEIRFICPDLSDFLTLFQRVYNRADYRESLLKTCINEFYDVYFPPPKFFHIRWTTWIITACYVKHYFKAIVKFVLLLEIPKKGGQLDKSSEIYKLKQILNENIVLIYQQLIFVFNYAQLNRILRCLESPDCLKIDLQHLQKAIIVVASVMNNYCINSNEYLKAVNVYKKLIMVINNNHDLPIIIERAQQDNAYANLPLTSAPIEFWFSLFRASISEFRPMALLTMCKYVFCKSNIEKYVKTSQSKEKRRPPENFNQNFDPKPKLLNNFNIIEPQFDQTSTMDSLFRRRHFKIDQTPTGLIKYLDFPPLPQIQNKIISNNNKQKKNNITTSKKK